MRYLVSKAIFAFFFFVPIGAQSAQPSSVKLIEDIILPTDEIYAHYIVTCNNGATVDVSAWDNKKKWCLGKGITETCAKKQIKIAKKACKGV